MSSTSLKRIIDLHVFDCNRGKLHFYHSYELVLLLLSQRHLVIFHDVGSFKNFQHHHQRRSGSVGLAQQNTTKGTTHLQENFVKKATNIRTSMPSKSCILLTSIIKFFNEHKGQPDQKYIFW